jgi:hypothetical protein
VFRLLLLPGHPNLELSLAARTREAPNHTRKVQRLERLAS